MNITDVGALCFGLVVGWITYRSLKRRADKASLSDIAAVIGAIGGAAVTGLFKEAQLFAYYSIGLAGGFFLYLIISGILFGKEDLKVFMSNPNTPQD